MNYLDCKICHIPFDEKDHQPRQTPCGHGLCTTCVKDCITRSIFKCPRCKKKIKVDVTEDLPVNFDLLDSIRAFKTEFESYLKKETEVGVPGASNYDLCFIHCKPIAHWCFKCRFVDL